MTMKKKVLIGLASLIVVLTFALASIPFFVDANRLRNLLVPELEKSLNRKVAVQSAELTLLTGPGVRLKQVVIFEDPQFGPIPFLKVDALRVNLRLLPLLSGKVEAGSIQIINPTISLVKNRAGIWNFETLGQPSGGAKEQKKTPSQPTSASVELAISALDFRNGTLSIRDDSKMSTGSESRYDQIDLQLEDLSATTVGQFSLQVRLPSSGAHLIKAQGRFGPVARSNLAKTNVDGKMEFTEIPVTELMTLAASSISSEAEWRGTISSEMAIRGNLGEHLHLDGKTRFAGLGSKRGKVESPEVSGELYTQLDYQAFDSSFQIADLRLSLPGSTIQLAGNLSGQGEQTRWDLKLNSAGASIEDLLKLASVLGHGPPKGVEAAGQAQMNFTVQGNALSPEITGQARLDGFQVRYPGLNERMIVSPWELRFERNAMTSNEVQISVGDRTRLKVQPTAVFAPVKQIRTTLRSQSPIPVADLMAIATTFGAVLPEGVAFEDGTISLQLEATKRLDESGDLSVNGQATIAGTRVRTPALVSPLEIRKSSLKFTGNSVSLTDLTAGLGSSSLQGTLQLVNFSSPDLVFTLSVDKLDLAALNKLIQTETSNPTRSQTALQTGDFGLPLFFSICLKAGSRSAFYTAVSNFRSTGQTGDP